MISKLMYVKGYLVIQLSGQKVAHFFQLCARNQLLLWNISYSNEVYTCNITKQTYYHMKELLKRTGVHCKIIQKCGLPFFLYRHRKRKLFVFGILTFFVLLYISSLYIWKIDIEDNSYYPKEMIQSYLTNSRVSLGTKISSISKKDIERSLREDFPELAWVSIEIKGTDLIVHLKERIINTTGITQKEPCNIIAQKDATIVSIITRNGTPIVKMGDTVKKGDILISGAINLTDDNNEVMETDYVPADGDIYAKTIKNYEETFPMEQYEKIYTCKKFSYLSFQSGNKTFAPYKGNFTKNEDDISVTHSLKLGDTFYLPFSFSSHYAYQYKLVRKKYDKSSAEKKANLMLSHLKTKYLEKGVEIVENNVKIMIEKDICSLKGTLTLKEPFGKIAPIEKVSDNKENSEDNPNGGNNSKYEGQ